MRFTLRLLASIILLTFVLPIIAEPQRDPRLAPLKNTGGRQFVTDGYGPRAYPMGGSLPGSFHDGIDLACKVGTPVISLSSGIVLYCATGDRLYGRYMVVRSPNGLDFKYAHLSETWYRKGAKISIGQVIGLSGATGQVTGPHLHIEITLDPSLYIDDDPQVLAKVDPVAYSQWLYEHGVPGFQPTDPSALQQWLNERSLSH